MALTHGNLIDTFNSVVKRHYTQDKLLTNCNINLDMQRGKLRIDCDSSATDEFIEDLIKTLEDNLPAFISICITRNW